MKSLQLLRFAVFCVCLSLAFYTYSQTPSLIHYESNILPNQDSTQANAVFVLALEGYSGADSLTVNLYGDGTMVFHVAQNVSAWIGSVPYRIEGPVLYLTIETGSLPYPRQYNAEFLVKDHNGAILTYSK